MRRSRVNSENTEPLKSPVDLKKSGTLFLRMASVRIAHMTRDEVMERLEHLGWNQLRTWNTRFSKRRASCANSRTGDAKSETNDMHRLESKEQDRAERRVQGAQHSAVGTRDETTADKEDQGGTSRARSTTTGNSGLRTTPMEDARMGGCPRQTALRVGGGDSRGGRCYSVATAKGVRVAHGLVKGNVSDGDELTTTEVAQ